jgi:hypothetical protein
MKLIYQGQILDRHAFPMVCRKPNAVNWRYQVPGETDTDAPIPPVHYRQPRAVNWRFRTPIED